MKKRNILVTGGAGFIGSSLIDVLIRDSNNIITCLDNFDPFYNPQIKKNNINSHLKKPNYKLVQVDICNYKDIKSKLTGNFDAIIHLAAKVGVKPSLKEPILYTEVNINGTQNLLELAKEVRCKQFIFGSSSSVYGVNSHTPWSEDDYVLKPISPYASTKISGELLGNVYSHLYGIQFIGLRFFSVYGPRQRPDLVIHKFTKSILEDKPISVYGNGKTKRDYTYIDDIVSGIISSLNYSGSGYEIINLGNNKPVELFELIQLLERVLVKKAKINKLPEQAGDVSITFADIRKAKKLLKYQPKTSLKDGIKNFVDWFNNKSF